MIASFVNCIGIAIGGLIGLFFGKKIDRRITDGIFSAMGLCVMGIGVSSAIKTSNFIHVIVCLIIGTVIGEALRIESRINNLGETLGKRFIKNDRKSESDDSEKSFAMGFLNGSLLFCVGSMAIVGSLQAGIEGNYSTIFSKSLIDTVSAVGMTASMGVGTIAAGVVVLVYQGLLTLLSGFAAPYLSDIIVNEISAVGGVILIGMALNMLDYGKHIRVGNMVPALILPVIYMPALDLLLGMF